MGLFSKFFGSGLRTIPTTLADPLNLQNPTFGFLNLAGEVGAGLLAADQRALGPLFSHSKVSQQLPPPQCEVLFVYVRLSPEGDPSEASTSPRSLIKAAHAYVAVFALENDGNTYVKRMGKRSDWGANIVMILNRNGDKFAMFFRHLFEAMFEGQTMPMAWVQLAPQGPSPKHAENPSSIFAAEAGHIRFTRTADPRGGGLDA
jgi:hypothetical protein